MVMWVFSWVPKVSACLKPSTTR